MRETCTPAKNAALASSPLPRRRAGSSSSGCRMAVAAAFGSMHRCVAVASSARLRHAIHRLRPQSGCEVWGEGSRAAQRRVAGEKAGNRESYRDAIVVGPAPCCCDGTAQSCLSAIRSARESSSEAATGGLPPERAPLREFRGNSGAPGEGTGGTQRGAETTLESDDARGRAAEIRQGPGPCALVLTHFLR